MAQGKQKRKNVLSSRGVSIAYTIKIMSKSKRKHTPNNNIIYNICLYIYIYTFKNLPTSSSTKKSSVRPIELGQGTKITKRKAHEKIKTRRQRPLPKTLARAEELLMPDIKSSLSFTLEPRAGPRGGHSFWDWLKGLMQKTNHSGQNSGGFTWFYYS